MASRALIALELVVGLAGLSYLVLSTESIDDLFVVALVGLPLVALAAMYLLGVGFEDEDTE